jgi:glycerol-3-phosphate acyltransferase PlsX
MSSPELPPAPDQASGGLASGVTRIAVDCMGGDHGPSVTLQACKSFLASHPAAELLLVGRTKALTPAAGWARCTIVDADEVVEMDDSVEVALRRKKNSSMRVALSLLRPEGDQPPRADACVSAGNTGALMAVARYLLKTLDGIDRPAIATVLPNQRDGYTTVLVLGANVDSTAEHLLQFAILGSALVSAVESKESPTVGLLNIGEEAIKGSETIKQAGELLRAAGDGGHINFFGNVEGNDIFKGTTDVVVCDGFVGNVMLKTAEGVASMLSTFIRQEFKRTWYSQLAGLVALPVLNHFKRRVDPRRYNGAALLGLRGLVFKSHGSADAYSFEQALVRAHDAARNGLLSRVQAQARAVLAAFAPPGADAHSADNARHAGDADASRSPVEVA